MNLFKFAGIGLSLALSTAAVAQTAPPPPPAEAKSMASAYVKAAGASDQFEIQSSMIAQSKSTSAAVRRFAAMLIADHQKTTAATMKAAAKAGLPAMNPTLDPGAQPSIDELNNASPADFDRLFIGQQIPAHQAALDLHQSYAAGGDQPALMASAKKAVPAVQKHLAMAQKMQADMAKM